METSIEELKQELFSYVNNKELNDKLWEFYQNKTKANATTKRDIIINIIEALAIEDQETTEDLREHICRIVSSYNKEEQKEKLDDKMLLKALEIEPRTLYNSYYMKSSLHKLMLYFYDKYAQILINKSEEIISKATYNAVFYADYAFVLYKQAFKDKKYNPYIQELLSKAIELNSKQSSAYLYEGYNIKEFYKDLGYTKEEALSLCEELYKKALEYGSTVAAKQLKSIKEQQSPECWIELMNADINLKSLVEQLEKSKVQAFSMLLYGPHGSGKEEFAQKLLDKLNLSYEEYSIADSEKTIQNKLLEMKQGKKAYIIKYSERLFLNLDKSLNSTPDYMSYLLQDILRFNQRPIFFIVDDINKIDINLASSFTFRIGFDYMDKAQKDVAYQTFFKQEPPSKLDKITKLVLEDFSRTVRKATALGCLSNNEELYSILEDEVKFKYKGQEYTSNGNAFSNELINPSIDLTTLTQKLCSTKSNFSMLIYGPPGTGKSYYLRYLAEQLGCQTLEKTATDLFSKFQGEPARKVAEMFAEQESKKALLILDEVDEILKSRANASEFEAWKVDMINAFLTCLDRAKYPVACTTNFIEKIDSAILRRFTFKFKFDYLTSEQNKIAYKHFFKKEAPKELGVIKNLTNGDFSTVKRQSILLDYNNDDQKILEALEEEVKRKLGDNYVEYDNIDDFDINLIKTNHTKLDSIEQKIKNDDNVKIAILGPSGSGKKTYIKYLAKKYEKNYKICIDTDLYTRGYMDTEQVKDIFNTARALKSILILDNIYGLTERTSNTNASLTQMLSNITLNQKINAELLEQIRKYEYPIFILSNTQTTFINNDKLRQITNMTIAFDYLNQKQIKQMYKKVFGVSIPLLSLVNYKYITPMMIKNIASTIEVIGINNNPSAIYKNFKKEVEKEQKILTKRKFAKVFLYILGMSSLLYLLRILFIK